MKQIWSYMHRYSFQWKKHANATKCLKIWQIWILFHILKKTKNHPSIHKLSTCTFVWSIMTFYTWNLKPSSAAFLRSPALSLTLKKNSKYHDLKINRARARYLSLSHSLTSSKNKNPNFCMKMKYLRHTCSLQYGDVGRRGRGRDYWNLIEILNYCKNVFFWDSNQFKSRL